MSLWRPLYYYVDAGDEAEPKYRISYNGDHFEIACRLEAGVLQLCSHAWAGPGAGGGATWVSNTSRRPRQGERADRQAWKVQTVLWRSMAPAAVPPWVRMVQGAQAARQRAGELHIGLLVVVMDGDRWASPTSFVGDIEGEVGVTLRDEQRVAAYGQYEARESASLAFNVETG